MKETFKNNMYLIKTFFYSVLILLIILILKDCVPFGEESIVVKDSINQYIPLFHVYHDKLTNLQSIMYSNNGGLGYDFYAAWLYYLSSPFNFLILLFKKEQMILVITILIVLKLSLANLAFAFYTKTKYQVSDRASIIFGFCYGFSSMCIAYGFNIMWLDVIIILPILILILDKMMKSEIYQKKYFILYTILLATAIISNFYYSIFLCIFIFILFFFFSFQTKKIMLLKFFQIAIHSFFAIGISSFIIIPSIFSYSSNIKDNFDFSFTLLENPILFFEGFLFITPIQCDMSFGPGSNVSAGFITFLFALSFFVNHNIQKKQKIKGGILFLIYFLILNISGLNYIFHGFDIPNGYVNRFSIILTFIVLNMAIESYRKFDGIKKESIYIFVVITFVSLFSYFYHPFTFITAFSVLASILISFSFVMICMFSTKDEKTMENNKSFLLSILLLEIISSIFLYIQTDNISNYYSNYEEYNYALEDIITENRIELYERNFTNENLLYNMPSMSLFSSSIDDKITEELASMGFRASINSYSFKGHTPVADQLFNIEYLLGKKDLNILNYKEVFSYQNNAVYKNKYKTSYAYLLNSDIHYWDLNQNNPFSIWNDFSDLTYGQNLDIYKTIPQEQLLISSKTSFTSFQSLERSGIQYKTDTEESYLFDVEYHALSNDSLYIYLESSPTKKVTVYKNEEIIYSSSFVFNEIIAIDTIKKDDIINLKIETSEKNKEGILYFCFATLNKNNYTNFSKFLESKSMDVKIEEGLYKTTVSSKTEQTLFFSVPNAPGWKAYIDKKQTKITSNTAFVKIDVPIGTHEIILKYETPGLKNGIYISIFFCFIFLFFTISKRKE